MNVRRLQLHSDQGLAAKSMRARLAMKNNYIKIKPPPELNPIFEVYCLIRDSVCDVSNAYYDAVRR